MQSGSSRFESFLNAFFSLAFVVFMVWLVVTMRRVTPLPASQLADATHPIVLQQTNTNGGLYQAILVGGDATHGTLSTATRLRIGGENPPINLSSALVGDLERLYTTWCSGERPVTPPPKRGYYEVVVVCGAKIPPLQLYFPIQDAPRVFEQLERVLPR